MQKKNQNILLHRNVFIYVLRNMLTGITFHMQYIKYIISSNVYFLSSLHIILALYPFSHH